MQNERPLIVPFKSGHHLEVQFRRPDASELESGSELEPKLSLVDTMCDVTGDWKVSTVNREAFAKLAIEGGSEMTQLLVIFGPLPTTSGGPAWDALPLPLQGLLSGAMNELTTAAKKVFRIMRWHWHIPGGHDPQRRWSLSWSPDRSRWQDLPWEVPPVVATMVPEIRSSEGREKEILDALEREEDEPIGHELLREAETQVDENPRSALIVGMAAAEIAVKEFVSRKVPLAAWLVTEAPTPPLLGMLTHLLPELVGPFATSPGLWFLEGKDNKTKDYLDPVLSALHRGALIRNRLVHRPADPPEPEQVKSILAAVRDLLMLLDHHAGSPYAWGGIRWHIQQAWRRS